MINVNELYLEVKGKWKSLYPIYFDSTKTIAEGNYHHNQRSKTFQESLYLKSENIINRNGSGHASDKEHPLTA